MLQASRAHLADVGETYFEHMRFALLVGALGVGACSTPSFRRCANGRAAAPSARSSACSSTEANSPP